MTVKSTNFGDFTEAGEALDLYGNAIRKSIATDVYKNKNTFSVVVLTKPLPISENGITVSGFKFKGRILDPETIKLRNGKTRLMGPPSPHRFLPDPCNLSTAAMKAQAIKIIGLHTEFSGPAEGAIPNPGDIVTVVLEPGDYSYNVARATFTKLVVKSANRSQSLQGVPGTSPSCSIEGMGNLFSDGAGDLGIPGNFTPHQYTYLGAVVPELQGTIVENGKLPESLIGRMNGAYSAFEAKVLKDTLQSWDDLAEAYYRRFNEKFPAQPGGGYRTFETQIKLRRKKPKFAAPPGTSNHGLGTAVDLDSGIIQFDNEKYQWLFKNAPTFNINHPCWARQKRDTSTIAASRCAGCDLGKCGTLVEVWHWELSLNLRNQLLRRNYNVS